MNRIVASRLGCAVFFFVLWQALSAWKGETIVPGPLSVAAAISAGFSGGWLMRATIVTLRETFPAFVLAVVIGFVAGVTLGVSRFWGTVFEPLILGTYSIPKVTLYPIFLLLLKVGSASKIAFGFFHGVFPVQILTQSATANLRPTYVKVARSFGLSRRQIALHVVLPAILPTLVVSLRLAFSLTFIGVVLGEMFASRAGLGFLLNASDSTFDMRRTLAIVVVLATIGITMNALFYALERRMGHWHLQSRDEPLTL